jgi:hypothetical protein
MTEPRRVLVEFDYGADGIWLCAPREELEAAPQPGGYWVGAQPRGRDARPRRWSGLLSEELLDDLKAWNDARDYTIAQEDEEIVADEVLEERGRELAIRVQNELGTDGWEVLYHLGGRVHRVHPPGSWPEETWEQDVMGYTSRDSRK